MGGADDDMAGFSEEAVAAFRRRFDPANEPPPPSSLDHIPAAIRREIPRHAPRHGERPHYWGHRERVRERLAAGGAAGVPDYEMVEMLLFNAIPRVDVKPLAKKLLEDFGGFERLLSASRERLARHPLVDGRIVHQLKLAEAVAIRLAKARIVEKPVLGGLDAVIAYCRTAMAHQTVEHFRVLFLDAQHRLVGDEEHGRGTVNHTPAYPREVARRALELNASGAILVHNHPSGDPTPSRQDIAVTRAMKAALATVSVVLHDHLIIGAARETSLAQEGLID
jgi:DNA repair protein RadC